MKLIIVPDKGEWVLVPKVATEKMIRTYIAYRDGSNTDELVNIMRPILQGDWEAMIAAAPQCKVVEFPAAPPHLEHNEVKAWYACLNEIERRLSDGKKAQG